MLAMSPAITPAWGLDSSTAHLLLSTSLLLCCILCMSCLILVVVTIRLVIPFRGASLLNLHPEPKPDSAGSTDSKSAIKGLADPLHKLIQAVHNHFTPQPASQPTSQSTSQPTTPASANPSPFKMTDTLQDVTAVVTEVSNQDIVFHVTRDFKISYWSSKTSDETQGEQYNSENLKINGNPIIVNSSLPILAAVAYKNPNTKEDEVRVYYVGEKSLTLREIRRTGKGKWYDGQVFNQQSYDIAQNSGLTANVVAVNKGSCDDNPRKEWQLKVYYQRKADILNVVYNVLNQSGENWSTRYGVNE